MSAQCKVAGMVSHIRPHVRLSAIPTPLEYSLSINVGGVAATGVEKLGLLS